MERVFRLQFFCNLLAEVVPAAVACDFGEEGEGVRPCSASVFGFAPSALECFFADGVTRAVFGHGEAFYFFDDVVAQFIECFLARGVYSALLFYFAEEEGQFCRLFIHGVCCFSWLKVRL